ncbi:hypothetical protein BBJ28_00023059, partial [Nothophytophthora sp. Chile5]
MENAEEMQTLIKAARSGSVQSVKQALEFGIDVDALSSDHWTALMAASEEGHTDVVELLLANKASVDAQLPNGATALNIACLHGQVGAVRALLVSGAAIELATDEGFTPLMSASLKGHTDVVELLLANKASVDAQLPNGATALNIACLHGQVGAVRALLASGAAIELTDEQGFTALMSASQNGHTDVVELLVGNARRAALDSITCFLSQRTDNITEAKPKQPNRWDATWGEAATRDRIGDHTAARYRHFRRFIDEHDEAVDASLFAELVSVEELRRELQPYEDASVFLRLALTGDLVEKLQHLNGVLDSAFAGGRVDLPERFCSWQQQLEQERDQRTEMYDELLQHEERREEALPVEWEDQLELLTMLKAGFETYSKDSKLKEHPLTGAEEQLVSDAYDLLASRSGIVIPSLPVWFVASTDASDESKLTRLGLTSSRPKSGTSEEVMETASQWWELHHPHIVRFMGACHAGQSPYFVHERTRSLALYLGANGKTRADVWKRLLEAARGVEYLHRRGFVHKHLTPADFLCAEFEAKTLLSGMGLVSCAASARVLTAFPRLGKRKFKLTTSAQPALDVPHLTIKRPRACRSERSASAPASADIRGAWDTSGGIPECLVAEDMRPSVASDIYSLGRCVFAFLGFTATMNADLGSAGFVVPCQDLPSHRPEYLDASKWDLIQKMCATDLNDRVNMTYVLEKMHEFAYPVEEEGGVLSTMDKLDEQILGSSGYTVRDFFVEFDEFSSEPDEPTRKAFTRLMQLHEMMKKAVPSPEPMVVSKYLSLLSRIMERIMDAMDKRLSINASVQATGSRYIDQTALTFSAEIDRVFRLLNIHEGLLVDSAPAFETSYFDKVQRMARSRVETSVPACDGSADSSDTQTSDENRLEIEAVQLYSDRQTGERRDQGNNRASALPRWFVPQFEVETGAFIVAGSFGSVYRGQWYGTEVVVKEIILKKGDTKLKRAEFLREANTWFQLNHRNVVKMYGGCHVGRLVFVCEYASQGSLESFSKAEGRDPLVILSTLLSAATGLRYLHDVGVVHGDLKGNNILIGKDGVAKLTDFGLSFFRKNVDSEAEQGALGAYRWKAPECLNGEVATFASDIFSFGMCIIEAVSGALPWGNRLDDDVVKLRVMKGELPKRPAVFEGEEWDLVQQMCCSDPKQRLNIVSVVVRLTTIVKRRETNRRQLLQAAFKSDMLEDRENERMDAHTGGLDTLLQLVQSGVASRQNAAKYSMQTFSELTQGNVLAEQDMLQVVKLFHNDDTTKDWAAVALGYMNCPRSAIRADVTSWLMGLIARESDGLLKAEAVRAIGYLSSDETSRTLI